MNYRDDCPILKNLTAGQRIRISHNELFKLCYKQYINCGVENCPRRLV